jgi:hypothetical protein
MSLISDGLWNITTVVQSSGELWSVIEGANATKETGWGLNVGSILKSAAGRNR